MKYALTGILANPVHNQSKPTPLGSREPIMRPAWSAPWQRPAAGNEAVFLIVEVPDHLATPKCAIWLSRNITSLPVTAEAVRSTSSRSSGTRINNGHMRPGSNRPEQGSQILGRQRCQCPRRVHCLHNLERLQPFFGSFCRFDACS